MHIRISLQKIITSTLLLFFLAGCNAPLTEPAQLDEPPIPTIPTMSLLLPTQVSSIPPVGGNEIFRFISTIQITPDDIFKDAALGYIHYIPATDRFIVMLGMHVDKPVTLTYSSETCQGKAVAYKEYTTDMQPTGQYGYISCAAADVTSQIIGGYIYLASMFAVPSKQGDGFEFIGWRLEKFDPVTWNRLADVDIPLDTKVEADDGPTISFINGQVTVSGEYFPDGIPDGPLGRGSHHHFFDTDLKPLGKKILLAPEYPPHCPEVSMIQVPEGDIYMFASTTYAGDLIVLHLDKDWNYKSQQKLRNNAFFPTGSVTDGHLFYVAYTDTSQKRPNGMLRNVGFAAFDTSWRTLQDVAVTDFVNTSESFMEGESPWVQPYGNRFYVSYIVDTSDPVTGIITFGQAYVNVYELIQTP